MADLSWRDDAPCGQSDPEAWFPIPGSTSKIAKRVCRTACQARSQCLVFALQYGEQAGIWGGFAPRERRPLHQMVSRGADADDVAMVALHGQEAMRWAG